MKAIQSLFSSNQFTLRLQPTFIAEGKLFDLFCQMQLQLLATLYQRSAELQNMLLNQARRCSHGHAAEQCGTVEILAQGQRISFVLLADERC